MMQSSHSWNDYISLNEGDVAAVEFCYLSKGPLSLTLKTQVLWIYGNNIKMVQAILEQSLSISDHWE